MIKWRYANPIPANIRSVVEEGLTNHLPSNNVLTSSVFPFRNRLHKAGALFQGIAGKNLVNYTRRSVYGYSPPARGYFNVWFTGENLRPPHDYDLTASFDLDTFHGTNLYMPLALIEYKFQLNNAKTRPVLGVDSSAQRPRDIAAFVGNPHPARMRAIELLSHYVDVDLYGRLVQRPVNDFFSLASQYKAVLCFENDLYPGYVTEKAVRAWFAGAIPLWWGDDAAGLLNSAALLNAANKPLKSFIEEVMELLTDNDRLNEMQRQSLINEYLQWWPANS